MDRKRIGTFVIYGGCFLLFIIGFSIPYWLENEHKTHMGLWQVCGESNFGDGYICISIISMTFEDYHKVTQAMETLGLIAAASGLFLCGIGVFIKPENNIIRMLAGVAGIVAGGFILIGVIVFGAKKDVSFEKYDLHAGFALTIVSSVGLAVSGILCLVIKSTDSPRSGAGFRGAVFSGGGGTPGETIEAT